MEYAGVLLAVIVLCTYEANGFRNARDLQDLMSRYDYNRMLLDNIKQPYEIIYPQLLDKGRVSALPVRKHKIRHHGTQEHPQQFSLQVVLDGKKYRIKLTQNEVLLSAGITVKHYEGNNQQVLTKTVEHCYYHGTVKKDEWSSVAVSTCNGIRGVIQMHNETYIIQPLIKDEEDTEHPHVIFKASVSPDERCGNSQGLWLPFQELHKGELIKRTKFANAQRNHHLTNETSPKLLRIAIVLDKSMYMGLEFSQQHVTQYTIDVANIVDLYYRELGFEVALTYLEFWNLHNHFSVDGKHRALLSQFLHFKTSSLPPDIFDAAFLIVGIDLDDKKVGVAVPDSICSERAVAIVKSGRPFEPQQTATTLSHMAGHVLGIEHDEDGGCECEDVFGCIMSTEVLGAGGFHSRMFSTCSKSDMDVSLNMGITSCLWGAPQIQTDFKQTCGNNIIERGEECDCGSPDNCLAKDPCCDPTTCLLQSWAQCRSGPCCSNCSFVPGTHMCRPRQSECDVPEFCDGHSGDCPFNTYIEDGHPCAENTGYCMGGICPTIHKQCQGIWGADARSGHDQCFQRFNPTGNFNGHCGKDKHTGSYAKCQYDDILCGLLHCEGGNSSPMYGSDKGFSTTNVNANNMEYECKTIHGPAMMDMPHMGMVQDGTKCGQSRVCLRNTCALLPSLPALLCPSASEALICSGHGVCAPNDLCFCEHGWEGEDCATSSNITLLDEGQDLDFTSVSLASTTSVEVKPIALSEYEGVLVRGSLQEGANTPATAPVTDEGGGISTTLLIIILATVIGALFLAMGVTLVCYRRRSPPKNVPSHETSNKTEKHSRSKRRWGRKKKWTSSEEESEMSELPPPPIIVMDPGSVMPEKGILKNSTARLMTLDHRGSIDSHGGSNGDQDSVGPYMYEDTEDAEAEEICNIFRAESTENMDHLQESASFDFVIPPPPPVRKIGQFESGMMPPFDHYENHYGLAPLQFQLVPQQQVPSWRTALPPQTLSPPQSRIVRLRNLTDYVQQLNGKATIDLSPSPEDLSHQQLSPSTSTSEDVRSSETEPDRMTRTSHSDHSPTSVTSNSTQHTTGPSFGSLSQYVLKRNEAGNKTDTAEDVSHDHGLHNKYKDFLHQGAELGPFRDQFFHHNDLNIGYRPRTVLKSSDPASLHMPPPMNPINIRNIFALGHTPASTVSRDSNNTSHGSLNGDNSSFTGTGNFKNGYEKSSGYGSEQDHERFSVDGASRSESHSRSNSLSRSHSVSPPSYSAVIRTGPNRIQLVPAGQLLEDGREIEGVQQELSRILENLPRINAGSFERSPLQSGSTPNTPLTGPLGRPPKDDSGDNSAPCIDRSLEEIPAQFSEKKSAWPNRTKRQVSMAIQNKNGGDSKDINSASSQPLITADKK